MPKSGYLCNHALCNRARPATITVEEARDLWGAIASIDDRFPREGERTAIAEPRRFNDNTTEDVHVLATKEIRLGVP